MTKKFPPMNFDTGCYFESARGQYIGQAVIQLAENCGMMFSEDEDEENKTPYGEFYHELWEMAENYLNSHVADDGFFFGSNESGDWGYWKNEEVE